MGRYHLNLTPWQAIGYALQWWDDRKTLDKRSVYTVRIEQHTTHTYAVIIQAVWGSVYTFRVNTETGRWSMFEPDCYHYKYGMLGLYKRRDLRALFLWAQRIMEHSTTI
jgi:hypothetical protein